MSRQSEFDDTKIAQAIYNCWMSTQKDPKSIAQSTDLNGYENRMRKAVPSFYKDGTLKKFEKRKQIYIAIMVKEAADILSKFFNM